MPAPTSAGASQVVIAMRISTPLTECGAPESSGQHHGSRASRIFARALIARMLAAAWCQPHQHRCTHHDEGLASRHYSANLGKPKEVQKRLR